VDFSATSPQVDWGGNVVYNFTYPMCSWPSRAPSDPRMFPSTRGPSGREDDAPEGCVVNCRFPAAVAARMQIGHFMTGVVFKLPGGGPRRTTSSPAAAEPPAQTNIFTEAAQREALAPP